jgi:curved DNA-binding protein CbpA
VDDYYDLVGVDRTASRETIDHALRERRRHWQQRISSADLGRRQEAERRLQRLGRARLTLLDEARRRRYDLELAAPGPAADRPGPREPGRFDALPEPIPPDEWVEEKAPAEFRYEPPAQRLGSPYEG